MCGESCWQRPFLRSPRRHDSRLCRRQGARENQLPGVGAGDRQRGADGLAGLDRGRCADVRRDDGAVTAEAGCERAGVGVIHTVKLVEQRPAGCRVVARVGDALVCGGGGTEFELCAGDRTRNRQR